jgi:cell division protein FtsW (lipid II flippase)
MIVERRLSAHIDWPLVAAVLALTLIGLATIYSVTWDFRNNQPGARFWAQVYALPVGLAALGACLLIDYRTLAQRSLFLYVALIAALVYVLYWGTMGGGARRWIRRSSRGSAWRSSSRCSTARAGGAGVRQWSSASARRCSPYPRS